MFKNTAQRSINKACIFFGSCLRQIEIKKYFPDDDFKSVVFRLHFLTIFKLK
jgi:hypothetical protein